MSLRRLVVLLLSVGLMLTVGGCSVRDEQKPHALDDLALSPEPVPAEAQVDEAAGISLFLVSDQRLASVQRSAPTTVTAAIEALLDGPRETEAARNLRSAIPPGTSLLGVSVSSATVTIDLSAEFTSVVGPEQILASAQVVYTATAIAGVDRVDLLIGGAPVAVARADGTLTSGPVSRGDFEALAPA